MTEFQRVGQNKHCQKTKKPQALSFNSSCHSIAEIKVTNVNLYFLASPLLLPNQGLNLSFLSSERAEP